MMLDNAATTNFITVSCVNKLKLPRRKTNVPIKGLGQSDVGYAKCATDIEFCSHFDKTNEFQMEVLIVPEISASLPLNEVDTRNLDHLKDLKLADPKFNIPAKVDILLGAELFYDLIEGVKQKVSVSAPIAINSALGWLVGGGRQTKANEPKLVNVTNAQVSNESIVPWQAMEKMMKQFWEIESVPAVKSCSSEEREAEHHFHENYKRDGCGRFIVRYPFKEPKMQLGESLPIAIRRFKSVERRLQKNIGFQEEYVKFMKDYESLGHMVEVKPPSDSSKFRCYIPHHFVLKEASTTTKFRVVFDASAKTSNGVSLNDTMLIGPTIQDSLANLIMRFRTQNIAITADIEKMYRQILIHEDDQELQHIIWRENPDKPFKHYKLLTVTYGTAAGPWLATKVLQVLADLEQNNFPIASKVLKEDFYMDDCMTGTDTVEEAINLQHQLIELLQRGQMSIRKFSSNSKAALKSLPEDLRETKSLSISKDEEIKALGFIGIQTRTQSISIQTSTRIMINPRSYQKG